MDNKNNNKGVIALLIVIIIILAVLCVLFATGTIVLKTKTMVNKITKKEIDFYKELEDIKNTNISSFDLWT